MDSQIALNKIKETEATAQAIIDSAKKEAQAIIHAARIKADSVLKKQQEEIVLECKIINEKAREEALREVSLLDAGSQEEIDKLYKKTQGNLEEALVFIKNKLAV